MKKFSIIPFLLILVFQTLCSCQDGSLTIREELLKSIAKDKDYITYRQATQESARLVAIGAWDRVHIRQLMDKYPDLENHCVFPDEELARIRGGLLWKKAYCEVFSHQKTIHEKYKDHKLTQAEWETVRNHYMEFRGNQEHNNLIRGVLNNQ